LKQFGEAVVGAAVVGAAVGQEVFSNFS